MEREGRGGGVSLNRPIVRGGGGDRRGWSSYLITPLGD